MKNIFLLLGQSNMCGRAEYSEITDKCPPNAYILNNDGNWEKAENPLNRYSTVKKPEIYQGLCPGVWFAKEWCTRHRDSDLGLVVNARGGSAIAEWQRGEQCFDEAVKRCRMALSEGGELKGILWLQGSQDRENALYEQELARFVQAIRQELSAWSVPFVMCEIITEMQNTEFLDKHIFVNRSIKNVANSFPNTSLITTEGLESLGDDVHYSSESLREIGKRFAKKYFDWEKRCE